MNIIINWKYLNIYCRLNISYNIKIKKLCENIQIVISKNAQDVFMTIRKFKNCFLSMLKKY